MSGKTSPPMNNSFSTVTSLLKIIAGVTVIAPLSALSINDVNRLVPVKFVADAVVTLIVDAFKTLNPKVFVLG